MGSDLIAWVQNLLGTLSGFGGEIFAGAILSGQQLAGLIGDLFQKADGLYKFLKASGSLDIVLGFAMSGPVGMMYFVMEHIYKALLDLWEWAKGIWGDILEGIINLPGLIAQAINNGIQTTVKALTGAKTGTPEEEAKKFGNIADTNAPPVGSSPEVIQAAALKTSHGLFPKSTDEELKDLTSQIYDYYNTPDGKTKDTRKARLNVRTKDETPDKVIPVGGVGKEVEANMEEQGLMNYFSPTNLMDDSGKKSLIDTVFQAVGLGGNGNNATPTAEPQAGTSPEPVTQATPEFVPGGKYQLITDPSVKLTGDEALKYGGLDPSNYVKIAHEGGESTSRGLVSVLPGEPIVPADLAQSSQLLDILGMIAYSPQAVMPQMQASTSAGGQSNAAPIPPINLNLNLGGLQISNASEGVNEDSVRRIVQDWLDKNLNNFEMTRIVEGLYSRGARYYNG
jgi:hypothetical protein